MVEQGGWHRLESIAVRFVRHEVRDNYSVMGRHKGHFRGLHPAAERGPEKIDVVVFIPGLQRERQGSTVGRLVLPLGHDAVRKKLQGPKGSLQQVVGRKALQRALEAGRLRCIALNSGTLAAARESSE